MNNVNWQILEQQWPQFVLKIEALLKQLDLWPLQYQIDHVALRTNQPEATQALWQQAHAQGAQLLSDTMVNGRPIYVFKSTQSWSLLNQDVKVIEMPFPGEKQYFHQGWEHIEIVLPAQVNAVADFKKTIQKQLPNLLSQAQKIEAEIKWSMPQAAGEQLANPTIAIKKNGVCIKLHPIALEHIVSHHA
ncbi:VOC family protein [Paraferrimonas sp. SM1919]|uniref:VOC family protein n=1 Tax=Paraferrimonas sp. SM1919 TaxID=2662263 RepID=UPI0013D01D7A|nr:VOC family protein [Paraferrimonas sp. SM1919]